MIKAILVSITAALTHLISWRGWTTQDRTLIQDMCRQVEHLERRRKQREILLRKGGL